MDVKEENILNLLQKLENYFKSSDSTSLAVVEFPETIFYKSEKWLIYIFYSCLLDYGVRSKNYHQNLILTYQKYPEIFVPQYVIHNFSEKKEELLKIIKENIHPRYPNVATDKWLKLSYELSKHKSLLTSMKNISNNTDLNLFVKSISGYGQKTGGLLLRLIVEAKICNFNIDLEQIPLDRHDMEISYLNGITKTKNLTPKQIDNLSSLYIKNGKKLNIKAEDIDTYLWEIGNKFCNLKKCVDCPLNKTCKRKDQKMNHKILILSHESDIDGLNCIVLAKMAFQNIEYYLFPNVDKLENFVRERINKNTLSNYQEIYITDLALYDPALSLISQTKLQNKVHVFDHHQKAINDKMNRYSFTKIIEEDEKGKKCGTDLFFEYLMKNNLINVTSALKEFVELTRLEDTWEWKNTQEKGQKAHNLAILFNALGREKYLFLMVSKLKNNPNSFLFDKEECKLINNKKAEYEKNLLNLISIMEVFIDENNIRFGALFANYEYRNELAEYIRKIGNPEKIKYLIIVAMDKGLYGQKSYRSIEDNFDVNKIASEHGGGGHPQSASVSIKKEQKEISSTLNKKEALLYLVKCNYKIDE